MDKIYPVQILVLVIFIRGTNFKQANLRDVKFIGVKAGLQRIWLIIYFLYILLLMFVSGSFSGLIGYSIWY